MRNKIWKYILSAILIMTGLLQPMHAEENETKENEVSFAVEHSTLQLKEESLQINQEVFIQQQRYGYANLEAGDLLDFGTGTYIYEYGMNSVTIDYNGRTERAILMEMFLNNERVYCIEPEVHTQAGEGYQPGNIHGVLSYEEQRTLGLISYFGYGYKGDYSKEMSAATMVAIWISRGRNVYDIQDSVMQKVYEIQNRVAKVDIKPSFLNQTLVFKGYGKEHALTLTDQNHVLEDYQIYDDGGYKIEKDGNSLKVWLEKENKTNGTIVFDRIPRETQGNSIIYVNDQDYQKLMRIYPHNSESIEIAPTIAKGSLRIGKVNEDGIALPDTTFLISYHEDMKDVIGTFTTDASGYIWIPDLEPLPVYIQEISVPSPYVVDSSIEQVNIIGNETVSFTKENRFKKGKIKLWKKDAASEQAIAFKDAAFAIYTEANVYVTTIYTDEQGMAVSDDLRYGTYYVKEVSSPDGYLLDDEAHYFDITEDEQVVLLDIYNERVTAEITIEKQDIYTGSTPQGEAQLDGAEYGLYAREDILSPDRHEIVYHKDELIMKKEIAQHTAQFDSLLLGKYYVKELTPSPGYTLDETIYPIDCLYEGIDVPVIHKHQIVEERVISQAFQIIKVSSDGSSGEVPVVEGAEFTIKAKGMVDELGWENAPIAKNAMGEESAVLITDNKGYAISEELPYGTYIVRETKTPEGLGLIADFQVTIQEDHREPMVWRVFNDAVIKAHIKVVKVDAETGKQIPSPFIRFKIRDLNTNEYVKFWIKYPSSYLIDTFQTDEDGSFVTPDGLPYGRYQIEEIKAPSGYVLDDTPLIFEIASDSAYEIMDDGVSMQILFKKTDPQVKGKIQLYKKAEIFSHMEEEQTEYGPLYQPKFEKGFLDGVKFHIYAKEDIITPEGTLWYHKDEYVETLITNTEGPVESSPLPLGSYYIKEISTKEGYVLDTDIHEVTLTYENQTTPIVLSSVTLWNEKEKGILNFTKQFEQSHFRKPADAAANTKFGVYTKEPIYVDQKEILHSDALLGVLSLDEVLQGHFTFDFAGTYYVKELESDAGYIVDDTMYDINFQYQQTQEQYLKLENGENVIMNHLKKGSLHIIKLNSDKEAIAGVVFELALDKDCQQIIAEGTTDNDGYLNFEDLEYGTYYLRERSTGDAYMLPEDPYEVQIDEDKKTMQVLNEYRISSIRLRKLDEQSRKPLEGVEFTLYDDFGNALQAVKTDKQGIAEMQNLKNGIYHIKETEALPGYQQLNDDLCIEIKGNDKGRVYEYEVTNSYIVQTGLSDHTAFYSFGMILSGLVFYCTWKREKMDGHKNRKKHRERIK